MGYRAHVHTKHVIKYGKCHFNWQSEAVHDWLNECGVDIYGAGECGELPEWEIDKGSLRKIPEEKYHLMEDNDQPITAEELHAFVDECLAAPTGESAYISWF